MNSRRIRLVRVLISCVAGFLFTALCHVMHVSNVAMVALPLLCLVVCASAFWGVLAAACATVSAAIGLNWYYLAPFRDLGIDEPEDRVLFVIFISIGILASHFWVRSRRQRSAAEARGRELENLQRLSETILSCVGVEQSIRLALSETVRLFACQSAALMDYESDRVFHSGEEAFGEAELRRCASERQPVADAIRKRFVVPLSLEGRATGSFAVQGGEISQTVCLSIANLLALAIGRMRAIDQSAKAEASRRSEEMKATVLDALAHNLKTPLTSIRAAVSSLLEIPAIEPAHLREILQVAHEETERLHTLIAEALDRARLDARREHMHMEMFNFADAMDRALDSLGGTLRRHEVTVHAPEFLPPIYADPELFHQVLYQLLDNAAKYAPPGTVITCGACGDDHNLEVYIANEGPGVNPHEQEKIFERFYRGQDSRDSVRGTGVGLSIVKAIMEAHGGQILVKSQPGVLTEFRVVIPASREKSPGLSEDLTALSRT